MKKQVIVSAMFILATALSPNTITAQANSPHAGLKMSLSIAQEGLVLNDAGPVRVSAKATRDFSKRFRGQQANWTSNGQIFKARFSDDTYRTLVGYAKSGRWLYTIRYYSEKQMSRDLRHIIKSEYYDYNIVEVSEVRTPQQKDEIYIIHINNDKKQHKILRFSDEGIEVVKTYNES
jgi:hypothetical protein